MVQSADKENKAPAYIPAYVPTSSKEEPPATVDESGLEHLFSGPIRTSGPFLSLAGTLGELFTTDELSSPTGSQTHHAEKPTAIDNEMIELQSDVLNLIDQNSGIGAENEHNDGIDAMDEMETLKVSQSPLSEMLDDLDINRAVKTEGVCADSDDESDAVESTETDCHNSNTVPPPNTDNMPNQVNPSTNSDCVL